MSDRDEYIKKIQSKLDEWDSDIDELKDKLEDAGEDVWEDIRDNIESGWKRVTAEFEDLVKRFKS